VFTGDTLAENASVLVNEDLRLGPRGVNSSLGEGKDARVMANLSL
jgi:hypothetical protein